LLRRALLIKSIRNVQYAHYAEFAIKGSVQLIDWPKVSVNGTGPEGTSKLKDIKDHQRHKKTTATNNDKCRKIRDKEVQKFQNFSLSCLYLSKFVTVVSHCLSNFLLSFIFDCSLLPRRKWSPYWIIQCKNLTDVII
jgi:hypothetical protein